MDVTPLQGEIALRLTLAALVGAGIGLERELRDQAAGLRTHMLVSVGACLFALVSAYGFETLVEGGPAFGPTRYDVSRVASNIVTGVGFLGAGAIIRHGLSVRGLTTAASLWVVAALGTAVAVGMYWATAVAAVITLLSLWGFRVLRGRIRRAAGVDRETIRIQARSEESLDNALDFLLERGFRIRHLQLDPREEGIEAQIQLDRRAPGVSFDLVTAELARIPGVVGLDRGD